MGLRLPLTTLPTLAPLEPGRTMREMGGLAFFSSRPADAPIVAAPELTLADGLNVPSRALRRVDGSSRFAERGTGCPESVLFLSVAAAAAPDLLVAVGAVVSGMGATD